MRRPPSPKPLGVLALALVVVTTALVWSLSALSPSTPGRQVSLSGALGLAAGHRISAAHVQDADARIVLTVRPLPSKRGAPAEAAQTVWVAYPSSGSNTGSLIASLVNAGANVSVDQQVGKRTLALVAQFILPLLLLATLFGIFILLARGGGQVKDLFAFSRIGARRAGGTGGTDSPSGSFTQVAGSDEAVAELAEIRDYLTDPSRFAAMGALPPKGVLLYGPPGCGKTLLAKSLAGEAKVPFYFISGSAFVESLVGVGAARVRDLFQLAVTTAPCIVFVDELDAAGRKRGAGIGGGNDEREQTLNELLVQMDGFAPTSGVVVIGATNRPDILDPALLRPGRFDRQVCVDLPDVAGRAEILALHARGRRIATDADLGAIARTTPGYTGADLANVINEAALLAVRRRVRAIEQEDLTEAVERTRSGPRRRGRILTDEELRRLAYHEAGHAVVASQVDVPARLHRISIVARGRGSAHTELVRSDRAVLVQSELLAELTAVMGGVAAEELVLGQPSTAGEADVARATEIAREFVGRYGMSDKVGRMHVLGRTSEVFLGRDYLNNQHLSTQTLAKVDDAVRELLDGAEKEAVGVLRLNEASLHRLAERLLIAETVAEEELSALLPPTREGGGRGNPPAPVARRTNAASSRAKGVGRPAARRP